MAEAENRRHTDRLMGMILGLAVGDALGRPIEGHDQRTVTGMEEGGPFSLDLPAGYWTDDTSMALCLADSLLAIGGYDSFDVMERYRRWYGEGYRSSLEYCFDIGNQVRGAIEDFEQEPTVEENVPRSDRAGNGCIMRLAPIVAAALAAGANPGHLARLSARETHYSHEAEDATEIFGDMLAQACLAQTKDQVRPGETVNPYIAGRVSAAVGTSAEQLRPSGYVLDTLECAVWAFFNHEDFATGALAVVNLGGDADTIGAVYGQLAGAYYGLSGIPTTWCSQLYDSENLLDTAEKVSTLTTLHPPRTRFAEDAPGFITVSQPEPLEVDWWFGPEGAEKLLEGHTSHQMEDKWDIHVQWAGPDDSHVTGSATVRFCRSWTGYEIFQLHVVPEGDGYRAVEVFAEQDERRYRANLREAQEVLKGLLLNRFGASW